MIWWLRNVVSILIYTRTSRTLPEINQWMTVGMAAGSYVVTAENHVGNITKLRR